MSRRHVALVLGLLISFGFLLLAFQGLDWQAFFHVLGEIKVLWLIPAIAVFFVVLVLAAYREQILLRPIREIPLLALTRIHIITAMGNNVYPFSGGEALRVYLLNKHYGVPIPTATTNVIVVRLVDGLVLIGTVIFSLSFMEAPSQQFLDITLIAAPVFLGMTAGFIALMLHPEWVGRGVEYLHGVLPERFHEMVTHFAEQFIVSLGYLRNPADMFGVIGITVAMRVVEAGTFWLVMIAFSMGQLFPVALLAVSVVSLAGVISASPGQIGVNQFAIVLVLTSVDVPRDVALAYAIVEHMVMFIPVTAVGFFLLLRSGLSWRSFGDAQKTQTQEMRQLLLPAPQGES